MNLPKYQTDILNICQVFIQLRKRSSVHNHVNLKWSWFYGDTCNGFGFIIQTYCTLCSNIA